MIIRFWHIGVLHDSQQVLLDSVSISQIWERTDLCYWRRCLWLTLIEFLIESSGLLLVGAMLTCASECEDINGAC